jgi:hypothetical protein
MSIAKALLCHILPAGIVGIAYNTEPETRLVEIAFLVVATEEAAFIQQDKNLPAAGAAEFIGCAVRFRTVGMAGKFQSAETAGLVRGSVCLRQGLRVGHDLLCLFADHAVLVFHRADRMLLRDDGHKNENSHKEYDGTIHSLPHCISYCGMKKTISVEV